MLNIPKLHHSAATGDLEEVKLLIAQHGADSVRQLDGYGNTPLHLAAAAGHQDIVETLVQCGAIVDARDSEGMTPLHRAVLEEQVHIVKVLVSHHADAKARDNWGDMPIDKTDNSELRVRLASIFG